VAAVAEVLGEVVLPGAASEEVVAGVGSQAYLINKLSL